ncbi:MAG TPA: 5-dehydro-2-deoxygluconokinase [Steroidobacteraceae bacterium]|nr:5-dehydro-2-deoxygluconokinase [Steroidobacteraceae bacterium]HNS27202.1 5-dehydro-2-deoxygluconokinase [Steroidobacteraceae bacterium]
MTEAVAAGTRALDVICLGRAAVDLYGQQLGGRFEDVQTFAKYLGGSSANLAFGLARLGLKSSMLSRVGDEHMGRFVREALARAGVDVSHLATDPQRLTALVLLGIAGRDDFPHIFYREHCADMGLTGDDFDAAYIASSRMLAITGTHLSSPSTAAAVMKAAELARAHGTRVVLDIDYRPVLWGLVSAGEGASRFVASGSVTARMQPLLPCCDLIVGTEEEIRVAGGDQDLDTAVRAIRATSAATLVVKRGAAGCTVLPAAGECLDVPGFPVEVLNTLGAGDAFLAGLLSGYLAGADWQRAATIGNACGALVVSRHGCAPALPSQVEIEDFLARAPAITRPDLDLRLQQLHDATTARRPRKDLYVLAFDHRRQLEDLAGSWGLPVTHINRLKELVADAVERVAARVTYSDRLGVIVDERYGETVLSRMTHAGYWVGRAIEIPGSRPLELEPRNSAGLPLLGWPANQVVKCLVFYHPDDPLELRLAQEERVAGLWHDTQALGRELLLEVVASGHGRQTDDASLARTLRRFYNLGIRPAWWKLEPPSPAAWPRIQDVIMEFDPYCNGVLLLGLDAPESQLRAGFEQAAPFPICRGFAVGRSIFGHSAREWMRGQVGDAQLVEDIATRYERLIDIWRRLRP